MDDGLPGGVWRLDDGVRHEMRVARIREALAAQAWDSAVVEAEELLDELPTDPDGLFLLAEALLQLGDFEIARRCFERRVELHGEDIDSLLGVALSAFQSCDVEAAVATAQRVRALAPDRAEAHFYLGLGLERMPGRATDAMTALATAAQLAPDRFPLPMQLDESDWQRVVHGALSRLHPELQRFYDGMDFRLEDVPSLAELRLHDPPLPPSVGAMYVGESPEPSNGTTTARPVAMRLFTRNLGRSNDEQQLVDHLAIALQDEALHWLGLTTADLPQP